MNAMENEGTSHPNRMNYRRLGRTNFQVSVVGFGTCQLRLVPEQQAIETLIYSFKKGVNIVHTSPDYEGADKLIAKALQDSDIKNRIYICSQSWGDISHFERIFEATCESFKTDRLDLFGICSLYDREMLGENVWNKGGMVEFLQRKKEEGRLGGIFCTTHGPLHHLKDRIERNVFDVIMVSYNVLGFHLLTYNPETLLEVAISPPTIQDKWEFENISRIREEIFPLIKERDIGLMIMKPLAGGLLCSSKAFPKRLGFATTDPSISAGDALRFILTNPEVSCVIPGTASVEEAKENAQAGYGDILLGHEDSHRLTSYADQLSRSICSRCGACDHTCSQGLPISWLFRAAYINLSPSATFENYDQFHYFDLHPNENTCLHCQKVSCLCPYGIDIRGNLIFFHQRMEKLSQDGVISPVPSKPETISDRLYSYRVIMKDVRRKLRIRQKEVVRIYLQNTGRLCWFAQRGGGHSCVGLAVFLGNHLTQTVFLRNDVAPLEKIHFVFEMETPAKQGEYLLRLDLFEHEVAFFSQRGMPPIEVPIMVIDHSEVRIFLRKCFNRIKNLFRDQRSDHPLEEQMRELGPRLDHEKVTEAKDHEKTLNQQSQRDYSASYLEHNIPSRLSGNSLRTFRVKIQNTGTKTWYRNPPDGHFVGLAVFMGDQCKATGLSMREKVEPGEKTVICVTLQIPGESGPHRLKLDMFAQNITMFEKQGTPPLVVDIHVLSREKTLSEKRWDKTMGVNYWLFPPGHGIHLSQDQPTYPLFARSAKGSHITDVEGREYIDLVMGWGCSLLGYANDRIQMALARELSSAGIISLPHPLEVEVSEIICKMIPSAEMALFGKNGSDACTAAVRMARAYTQRKKILVCGYHGWQDWYAEQYGFAMSGVPERADSLTIGFPYRDIGAVNQLLHTHAGDVAAVMIEPAGPVPDLNGPIQDAETGYLENLAAMTKDAGALLIFDEIISGFRYRESSVQKAHGVIPDLTCLGKALSGGMPLSALVGKRNIFEQTLYRITYLPTFKGEVYSLAAAKEALQIYQREDIPSHISKFGNQLKREVNQICIQLGLPAEVIGPPFRMTMAFQEPDAERRLMMRTLLVQELLKHGVITWKGFMLPSYAHTDQDLKEVIKAFERVLSVLCQAWKEDTFLKYLEFPDNP